ncbi:MAG: hypothetical protein KF752_18135 [Pirellulaceae bacterium]|nr:hypothetical protein [Pirellulaceae bacterium]
MQRTTSIRPDRTRPNSRSQPQNVLENIPVLLRLPRVEQPSFSSSTDFGGHALTAADEDEQSLAQPTSRTETRSAFAQQPAEFDSGWRRSWWEHWSSGVVLIVLIILLILLSIIAFRPSGKSHEGASSSTTSNSDFGDLDQITVPTLEIVQDDTGPTSTLNSQAEFELLLSGEPSSTNDAAQSTASEGSLANRSSTEVENALADGLMNADISPALTTTQSNNQPTSQLAQAQLMQPQPIEAQKSLSAVSGSGIHTPLPGSQLPGSQLASNQPVDNLAANNLAQSNSQIPLSSSPVSGSPALPNLTAPSLSATSMPNLGSGDTSLAPNTKMVGTAGGLASTVGNATAGNAGPTDTSSMTDAVTDANAVPTTPTIRSTSTPEADDESIIRAYLELTRTAKRPAETTDAKQQLNRYPNTK